jgi:hypothetical protein
VKQCGVPADASGKRQHVVETLNIIDMGTSILLDAHVRPDFTAETALEALSQTIQTYGCPHRITLDRDTRWVGSPHGSDFPAALIRFATCWLQDLDGLHLERKVDRNGTVSIDLKRYYISAQLKGHRVVLRLDAQSRSMQVIEEQKAIKSLVLRGLMNQTLSFEQFLVHMQRQARAQERLRSMQERKYRTGKFAAP